MSARPSYRAREKVYGAERRQEVSTESVKMAGGVCVIRVDGRKGVEEMLGDGIVWKLGMVIQGLGYSGGVDREIGAKACKRNGDLGGGIGRRVPRVDKPDVYGWPIHETRGILSAAASERGIVFCARAERCAAQRVEGSKRCC